MSPLTHSACMKNKCILNSFSPPDTEDWGLWYVCGNDRSLRSGWQNLSAFVIHFIKMWNVQSRSEFNSNSDQYGSIQSDSNSDLALSNYPSHLLFMVQSNSKALKNYRIWFQFQFWNHNCTSFCDKRTLYQIEALSHSLCTHMAIPIPPPTHNAATPFDPPVRSNACIRVTRMRAPDAPIGWPSAIAPPPTLT